MRGAAARQRGRALRGSGTSINVSEHSGGAARIHQFQSGEVCGGWRRRGESAPPFVSENDRMTGGPIILFLNHRLCIYCQLPPRGRSRAWACLAVPGLRPSCGRGGADRGSQQTPSLAERRARRGWRVAGPWRARSNKLKVPALLSPELGSPSSFRAPPSRPLRPCLSSLNLTATFIARSANTPEL